MPMRKKLLYHYFLSFQKSELSPAYFTADKRYKVLILNVHTLCTTSTLVYAAKLKRGPENRPLANNKSRQLGEIQIFIMLWKPKPPTLSIQQENTWLYQTNFVFLKKEFVSFNTFTATVTSGIFCPMPIDETCWFYRSVKRHTHLRSVAACTSHSRPCPSSLHASNGHVVVLQYILSIRVGPQCFH
jgi:hypothetical protein